MSVAAVFALAALTTNCGKDDPATKPEPPEHPEEPVDPDPVGIEPIEASEEFSEFMYEILPFNAMRYDSLIFPKPGEEFGRAICSPLRPTSPWPPAELIPRF